MNGETIQKERLLMVTFIPLSQKIDAVINAMQSMLYQGGLLKRLKGDGSIEEMLCREKV